MELNIRLCAQRRVAGVRVPVHRRHGEGEVVREEIHATVDLQPFSKGDVQVGEGAASGEVPGPV